MLDCGGVLMSVERLFQAWGYYVFATKNEVQRRLFFTAWKFATKKEVQRRLIFDAWKKLPKRTLGDGAAEDTG